MAGKKNISKPVRDKLLVDAMHRCCLCPEHNDIIDAHHIVQLSEGGPNTEDNLMAVCPTCHAKIHRIGNRYNTQQLRMYKDRWVRLCREGLPLDVRLAQAEIHNLLATVALDTGDRAAAAELAKAARERAWCDGPSHCYKTALDQADAMLERLGITPEAEGD